MNCVVRAVKKYLVVLALVSSCGICASAQKTCSNQDLNGAFGFIVSGTNVEFKVLFAVNGRFLADGQGTFYGTANESVGGQIVSQAAFKGTYTMRPDCTGTALFAFPNDQFANLEFVLVDDGNEMMILDTDKGTVEFGTAKKQFPRLPARKKDKGASVAPRKQNK